VAAVGPIAVIVKVRRHSDGEEGGDGHLVVRHELLEAERASDLVRGADPLEASRALRHAVSKAVVVRRVQKCERPASEHAVEEGRRCHGGVEPPLDRAPEPLLGAQK